VRNTTLTFLATAWALALFGCAKPQQSSTARVDAPIQEMRHAIEKKIPEPARQAQLLSIVDTLDGVLKEHATDLEMLSRDLSRLNADYDSPREAFDKAVSDFAQRAHSRKQRVLDLHFQMSGLTSAEEWKPISKHEAEAIGAARSYFTN
jgi:capsule polysaccharide modification protein KpsS